MITVRALWLLRALVFLVSFWAAVVIAIGLTFS